MHFTYFHKKQVFLTICLEYLFSSCWERCWDSLGAVLGIFIDFKKLIALPVPMLRQVSKLTFFCVVFTARFCIVFCIQKCAQRVAPKVAFGCLLCLFCIFFGSVVMDMLFGSFRVASDLKNR